MADRRAVTMKQPSADLVMYGMVDVLNLSWPVPSTLPQWQRCPCGAGSRYAPGQEAHHLCYFRDDGPFPFRLGIHAAKHHGPDVGEALIDLYGDREYHIARSLPGDRPDRYGALLGTVEVTGCHHADENACLEVYIEGEDTYGREIERFGPCSRWAELDRWHWTLSDPQPLDAPIPIRGRQGLWRLPEEVDADA